MSVKLILNFILTIIGYVLAAIVGLICLPPCFLLAMLPEKWRRDNKLYFFFAWLFYNGMRWSSLLPITYEGLENIPKEPVIFAPNHLSAMDIPVVGSLVGMRPHLWLFLKRYAKVPFFGFIARRMNVVVDLSTPQKMMRSMKQGIKLVKGTGRDLIIFPEGGRAIDGKIQKFFPGFAVITNNTGLPVVPVYLHGLDKAYPIGSFLVRRCPITVRVGPPFHMRQGEERKVFMQRVYHWFLDQSKQ